MKGVYNCLSIQMVCGTKHLPYVHFLSRLPLSGPVLLRLSGRTMPIFMIF